MIKYILIITMIAALVPASMLNVSASTSNVLFITTADLTTPKEMELKATNENGETRQASDFEITVNNVISISEDGSIRVFAADNDIEFTKARTTDVNDRVQEIAISSDGDLSFAGYNPGVYVLDVVVDDERAYEAIVVIGIQTDQTVNKEIIRINNKVVTDVEIKTVFTFPKQKVVDKEKVCLFTPHHPICDPDKDGKCPDNWSMNEDGQCFPHYKKCPPNYWRADDDETGACVKIPKEPIYAPDDPFCAGDPKHIGCPGYYDVIAEPEPKAEPQPIIGKCFNGATPVNGVCPKPTDDPNMNYCQAYGCPGSPAIPIEEEDEGLNDVVVNDKDNTDNEEPEPVAEADEENQDEGESSGDDGGQSDEEVTSG
jgi:hypothetical protein